MKTADMLGVSAIITHELHYKATVSYEFNMDEVIKVISTRAPKSLMILIFLKILNFFLQYADDVGGDLQLAHCRLCSLQRENANVPEVQECDPSLLTEPAAIRLAYEIGRFPEVLCDAQRSLNCRGVLKYSIDLR